MSRGHGRIQLQVLEFLLSYDESARARGDHDAYVSIAEIAGEAASRSRVESIRRAAKSLAEEGLIVLRTDVSRPAPRDRQLSSVHASYGLMVRLAAGSDLPTARHHADSSLSA